LTSFEDVFRKGERLGKFANEDAKILKPYFDLKSSISEEWTDWSFIMREEGNG
jgi:hypothetical protein